MQWGSKVRKSQSCKTFQGNENPSEGYINLFYLQVSRNKFSLPELNKGTLVYSQERGQGPPGRPLSIIIVSKVMKSKSKKQFSTWSENWLSPCNKMKEPHFTFLGINMGNNRVKGQPPQARKRMSRQLNLDSDTHTWAYIKKNHHSK